MFCSNCAIENEMNSGPCRSCGLELSEMGEGGPKGGAEANEKSTASFERVDNDEEGADRESKGMERTGALENAGVLYAGFWKRAAATSIDSFLLFIIGTGLGLLYIAVTGSDHGLEAASNILGILFGWLYFAYMESSEAQATLGKRALGIVVTDINGKRISFYRATGRHFSKIVSSITLGFGFVMAGFTAKKQALHDKMFDCLVVVKQ